MFPFTVVPMDASKLLDFIDKQNIELCSKSHVGNSGVDKFADVGNDEHVATLVSRNSTPATIHNANFE